MHSTLRRCVRVLTTHSNRRLYSREARGSFFGFECSKYAHRDYDLDLLEKSIRYGCSTVVEKSAADDSIRTYELLVDIAATEDSEISELFLIHLIGDKSIEGAISVKNEITNIQNVLKKRSLDVISVPLPSLKSLHALQEEKNVPDRSDSIFQEALHKYFTKSFDELLETCDKSTKLGVDITTEWLAAATELEVSLLLSAIQKYNEKSSSAGTGTGAGDGGSEGLPSRKIKCLSVATNSYTHKHLSAIHAWAVREDIMVVSTEVLKGHPTRPGQLSVEGGRLKLTPTKPEAHKDHPLNNDPWVITLAAVDDFNRAMNACVQVEKEYVKRFAKEKDAVPASSLCWGHNLSQAQDALLFPEEWDYFYEKQVGPMLSDAVAALKNSSEKEKEWAQVYNPLSKKLFGDFNTFLEKRRIHLCHDIRAAISKSAHNSENKDEGADVHDKDWTAYRRLPQYLATISSTHGSDSVAVASAVVLSNDWMSSKDTLATTLMGDTTTESKNKIYGLIGTILSDFNNPKGSA